MILKPDFKTTSREQKVVSLDRLSYIIKHLNGTLKNGHMSQSGLSGEWSLNIALTVYLRSCSYIVFELPYHVTDKYVGRVQNLFKLPQREEKNCLKQVLTSTQCSNNFSNKKELT